MLLLDKSFISIYKRGLFDRFFCDHPMFFYFSSNEVTETFLTSILPVINFRIKNNRRKPPVIFNSNSYKISTSLTQLVIYHITDVVCICSRSEEHTSELQSRGHLVC